MESGGAGGEGTLEEGNERKMCVSAELLKPSQALSWAMGQCMTYLCLCVGTGGFLQRKDGTVR